MRSVDIAWRACALVIAAAVASGGTGCASLGGSIAAGTTSSTSAAPASAPTPGGAASGAARAPEAPVSPAVQRAFGDASRALQAGRSDEAERGFRALAQADPTLGGPHANLGLIARQAGKLPQAVAEFEQAVRLNPNQPVYLNQLGITYRQQGQFAKARAAYEQAIALDPGYAAPYLNLAILHDLYLGDGARALEWYGRYLALAPGGDAVVAKWIADLKNRKPAPPAVAVSRKDKS
jgi:Flp pilus assembly protein TadD